MPSSEPPVPSEYALHEASYDHEHGAGEFESGLTGF